MNKSRYIKLYNWFENRKGAKKLLETAYKFLPFVFILAVPVILVAKGLQGIDREFVSLLVVFPCVFLGITVMRRLIKRERPYIKYNAPSVIPKNSKSYSFPSRHTASAFIIAMGGYTVCLYFGIFLTVLALTLAVTRILAGVHYISDIVFAIFFSVLFGAVFFFII